MSVQNPDPWTPPAPLPGPIETERLLVRFFEAGDARSLHETVVSGREALLPWLPWAKDDHGSVEASTSRIAWFDGRREEQDYTMGIFEKATGEVIGGTGLHRIIPEAREAEIGYWVHPQRHGEGICTEAVAPLISAAFAPWGFRRIRIHCAAGNGASQRVAEKVGAPLEGRLRRSLWVDGIGWDDTVCYGVLADEWDCEQHRPRTT